MKNSIVCFGILIIGSVFPTLHAQDTVITTDTIQNGGVLQVNDDSILYISHSSNNPTLTLTNGANVSFQGATVVGGRNYNESGILQIQNGSVFSNNGSGFNELETNNPIYSGEAYIGLYSGSVGSVLVSGNGSKWTNSQTLIVGNEGQGTLTITDGGTVESQTGRINYGGGSGNSQGVVIVSGQNSTWTNMGFLEIGQYGSGYMTVSDGGRVTSLTSIIGTTGMSSSVTVSGSGSRWDNSSILNIGWVGVGELIIENGGRVTSLDGFIGRVNLTESTVTVSGSDSTWDVNRNLILGGSSLEAETNGTGALEIGLGGSVNVTGATRIHGGGVIHLEEGGTLNTGHFDPTNGVFNFNGGTLSVNGTYTGDLFVPVSGEFSGSSMVSGNLTNAGLLSPGNSPGITNVTGDYLHENTATLLMEIGGLNPGTGHDQLSIDGTLEIEGGTLQIAQWDSFMPVFGNTFALFTFSNLIGSFDDIDAFELSGGREWDFSNLYTDGTITVIPEPSTMVMLFVFLGASVLVLRGRKG